MNRRLAAAANLLFSSAQAVFTIVTGLLMVPLYLRRFDLATYGAWLASGSIVAMLALVEPGIATVATQKLAACVARKERERFAEIFGSALLTTFAFSAVVAVAGILSSPFLPTWIGAPHQCRRDLSIAIALSSAGTGTSFLSYTLGAAAQAWQRTVAPGAIGLVALTANVGVVLVGLHAGLGVIALGVGALALALTWVLGYALYIAYVWRCLQLPLPYFTNAAASEIWREARVLLVAKLAGAVGRNLEAPAAAVGVSPEAAAVLVLTGRVLTAVQMFVDRVATAVFAGVAHVSAERGKRNGPGIVGEVVVVSAIASGVGVGFSLALSEPIVLLWVGKSGFGGLGLIALLALAGVLGSRKDLVASLLTASGQIRVAAQWLALESGLRVACIFGFVIVFKTLGVPMASAVASLVTLIGLARVVKGGGILERRTLFVPGTLGAVISLGLGALFMLMRPEAANWLSLTAMATGVGLVLVAASLLDAEWRRVVRNNILVLRPRLSMSRHDG